jgi:hypothetical protein
MKSFVQHMANPTYKVKQNPDDGKWYVYGEVRRASQWMRNHAGVDLDNLHKNQFWMPVSKGMGSKAAAEKFQKTNPPVDDRMK